MRFKVSFAELHAQLFMGNNLGLKIGEGQAKAGVTLEYDTTLQCLIVYYMNKLALVPAASVASMTIMDKDKFQTETLPKVEFGPPAKELEQYRKTQKAA